MPRALVGFEAAAAAGANTMLARTATAKLRAGGRLTPSEREILEIGIRLARPALRIEHGRLPLASQTDLVPTERETIETLMPGIASVGWRWDVPLATAFQVAPRVLATSAHVAERLLRDSQDLERGHCVASFDADAHRPRSVISITGVCARHPVEDVALLELASDGPLRQGLRLAREPWLARGDRVLAVGYPLYSASTPDFIEALFENMYGVKRASPGELLGVEGDWLYHDCTTLSGNSGSPLIDMRTGLVVGVHASGWFAFRNTAVSTRALHAQAPLRAFVSAWG